MKNFLVGVTLIATGSAAFASDGWLGLRSSIEASGSIFDRKIEKVLIESTTSGSPAERAGLKQGDTILAIYGREVRGAKASELAQQLQLQAGQQVTLTVRRGSDDNEARQIVITAVEKK
ncbi:PDZ domain-containing protein [Pelomonas nitida]|uniref:PDZ domain-containing protein n=1 Tax=Pelomonas nitida TaxID=3299027 RepID=A0ABW7G0X6_9BURK